MLQLTLSVTYKLQPTGYLYSLIVYIDLCLGVFLCCSHLFSASARKTEIGGELRLRHRLWPSDRLTESESQTHTRHRFRDRLWPSDRLTESESQTHSTLATDSETVYGRVTDSQSQSQTHRVSHRLTESVTDSQSQSQTHRVSHRLTVTLATE